MTATSELPRGALPVMPRLARDPMVITMTTSRAVARPRTAVGEMIDRKFDDPFVKAHIGQLKALYGALSNDIRTTIKVTRNKDLLNEYDRINEIYKTGRAQIASQYARTIARLARNGQYSKIITSLIKPSMAIEDIPRIMAIIGEQGAKDLRSAFMRKLFDDAKNADGDFTPQGVLRQIKKYGEDKVSAILSPEQVQGIKDLGTLSNALGQALKMSQGSQTAFLLRSAAELGAIGSGIFALVTGNLPLAAKLFGTVLGAEGASYFLASNMGQKLLMWGITRGSEFANVGKNMGLTLPPEDGTMGTYAKSPNDGGGSPGGNSPVGLTPRPGTGGSESQPIGDGHIPSVDRASATARLRTRN